MPKDAPLLLFDVNETLSDLGSLAPRLSAASVPAEVLPTWFAATLRDGFALTAVGGYADFATVAREALRTLLDGRAGWEGDPDEAARQVVAGLGELDVHPDVPSGVKVLHKAGYRLATFTNGSADTTEALLDRAGLLNCFEAHLDVAAPGCWKPAAAAYRYAVERLGASTGKTVLVSVHPWDIHGARHAGLGTAWVHRGADRYPAPMDRADHEARTFDLLAGALCL